MTTREEEIRPNFEVETAYARGRKAGREDGFIGKKQNSFWCLANSASFAAQQFGQGYRDGFEEVNA